MNEVYEYRKTPNRGVIWLSTVTLILLMTVTALTGSVTIMWLVWGLGAALIFWMILPKPIAGIMVDDDYLVLGAWRRPRKIPLDDIAFLRATAISADSDVTIVYKDGREEGTLTGDMPDIETLAHVMAARGVPVRDIY